MILRTIVVVLLTCFGIGTAPAQQYQSQFQTYSPTNRPTTVGNETNRAEARQWIESSSPLPDGRRVTSRTVEGGGVQTFVEIANLPVRGADGTARQAPISGQIQTRYPYPVPTRPVSATVPVAGNPYVRPTANQMQYAAYQRIGSAYPAGQFPGGVARKTFVQTAQNNTLPVQSSNPAFQAPTLETPPVSIQVPIPGDSQYPPFTHPQGTDLGMPQGSAVVSPQFSGNRFRNWWTPIVTGTGAYQPIIRLQNLPPGTYLGQGIIGQPKAYVDGQPIRNLLRYLLP